MSVNIEDRRDQGLSRRAATWTNETCSTILEFPQPPSEHLEQ
jgi:hypothetical protein